METNTIQDRRKFLIGTSSIIGAGLLATTFSTFLSSCEKSATSPTSPATPIEVNIANYPSLQQINGFMKLTFQGKNENMPIIFIRKTTANFTVLSSKCGHQGCEVNNPDIPSGRINCPCHGSSYDLNGNILNGPTTKPLQNFANTFDANTNILTVTV